LGSELIVEPSQDDEKEALETFDLAVERYRASLVRKAASIVGPDLAEDMVQEAMMVALRHQTEPRSWANWLFALVRRQCLDYHRQRVREEKKSGGPIRSLDEIQEKRN
jgi:DNA-directed RNA polymerase specialized sigma24 family protein